MHRESRPDQESLLWPPPHPSFVRLSHPGNPHPHSPHFYPTPPPPQRHSHCCLAAFVAITVVVSALFGYVLGSFVHPSTTVSAFRFLSPNDDPPPTAQTATAVSCQQDPYDKTRIQRAVQSTVTALVQHMDHLPTTNPTIAFATSAALPPPAAPTSPPPPQLLTASTVLHTQFNDNILEEFQTSIVRNFFASIVQQRPTILLHIGASQGWEHNLNAGGGLLQLVAMVTQPEEQNCIRCIFVEESDAQFKQLVHNIEEQTVVANGRHLLIPIHASIVARVQLPGVGPQQLTYPDFIQQYIAPSDGEVALLEEAAERDVAGVQHRHRDIFFVLLGGARGCLLVVSMTANDLPLYLIYKETSCSVVESNAARHYLTAHGYTIGVNEDRTVVAFSQSVRGWGGV